MKILSIASLLPIPDIVSTNDFVFQTYKHLLNLHPEDTVVILKPVKISLNIKAVFKKTTVLSRLSKNRTITLQGFRVEVLPFLSTWSLRNLHSIITRTVYFLNRKRIKSLFEEYDFDVIHAQYIFSDGLLASILSEKYNIPYFITSHNERDYFKHAISRRIAFKVLSKAHKVLPINHSNSEFYKGLGLKNIHLTPLGFSEAFLKPQKSSDKERIKIITVAELIKLKNIDKVILAFNNLATKYNINYTIVGRGPEDSALRELVNSLNISDKVEFLNFVPHEKIAETMYQHDIFIMPSYFETFGRVYFEVMAMGIPIICARNSGIYGIFKDEVEGLAVDHSDISELIKSLDYLISSKSKRLEMGLAGQNLVKNFTWANIANQIHDYYEEAVQKNK